MSPEALKEHILTTLSLTALATLACYRRGACSEPCLDCIECATRIRRKLTEILEDRHAR